MTIKLQSAMEYLVTYGWAIVLIVVVLSLVYYFLQLPQRATAPTCSFQEGILCQDVNIGATSAGIIVSLSLTNELQYPLLYPTLTLNYQGSNLTPVYCAPPGLWVNGRSITCYINIPGTSNVIGQFISGTLYLSAQNCGASSSYLSAQICVGAPSQTFVGDLSGHTEAPVIPYIYVANGQGSVGCIITINPLSNTWVNTITLPSAYGTPVFLASNPQGTEIYATDGGVTAMNPLTRTVTQIASFGSANSLHNLTLSTSGGLGYIAATFSPTSGTQSVLYTFNTSTGNVVNTITLNSIYSSPQWIVLNTKGTFAYYPIKSSTNSVLAVINTQTYQVTKIINFTPAGLPWSMSLSPTGQYAYIANDWTSGSSPTDITTISLANGMVVNTLSLYGDFEITGQTLSPSGTLLYALDNGNGNFIVVNVITDTVVTVLSLGATSSPRDVVLNPTGTTAYVTAQSVSGGLVDVINTISDTLLTTINAHSSCGTGLGTVYGLTYT